MSNSEKNIWTDIKDLKYKADKYERLYNESKKRIDSILYMYEGGTRAVGDLHLKLSQLESNHKKKIRKQKRKYDKMQLKLILEIMDLKSQLYKKDLTKKEVSPILYIVEKMKG